MDWILRIIEQEDSNRSLIFSFETFAELMEYIQYTDKHTTTPLIYEIKTVALAE